LVVPVWPIWKPLDLAATMSGRCHADIAATTVTVALAKDGKYNAEAAAVVAEATAAQNRQFDRLDQDRQRPDPKQRDLRLPSSGDHWSA